MLILCSVFASAATKYDPISTFTKVPEMWGCKILLCPSASCPCSSLVPAYLNILQPGDLGGV